MATGRSGFADQVNDSLGFPCIFRGTLDVKARTTTDEMCIAASYEQTGRAIERARREIQLLMDEGDIAPAPEAWAAGAVVSSRILE